MLVKTISYELYAKITISCNKHAYGNPAVEIKCYDTDLMLDLHIQVLTHDTKPEKKMRRQEKAL